MISLSELKKITLQELEENNGKDGKPAYFAYKGKVYDVSESGFWLDGDHVGMHQAGKDLTEELDWLRIRKKIFRESSW